MAEQTEPILRELHTSTEKLVYVSVPIVLCLNFLFTPDLLNTALESRVEGGRGEESGVEWSGVEWSGVEWSGVCILLFSPHHQTNNRCPSLIAVIPDLYTYTAHSPFSPLAISISIFRISMGTT